ncbi:MAG: hypothetical protein QOG64_1462 [Acidimicrobiaceae bacterium]|nr:hypothetical protein [Acidimicrobiaceae bacterium]
MPPGAGDLPESAFRLIVDVTAHPFTVIGADGTIRYAGGSVERALGWLPDQLAGRNMAEFLPADQLELAIEAIAEIEEIDRGGAGVPMVFGILRPDGETTWVEVGAMPMLDVEGVEGIVLRHRAWDAQHHFDRFLAALLADSSLDVVLAALASSIAASLEADGAVIHHGFDGASFGEAAGCGLPVDDLPLDDGPWCETARSGQAAHMAVADLPAGARRVAEDAGMAVCWTSPVEQSEGLAPAVVSVWRSSSGGPLLGHRHALERSARFAQLALVRTAEHQRLRHLAGHDALTGVANRVEFRDRLAHALAIGERDLAVAFCDLDHFKPINDTYGHRGGDTVLVQVADRLRLSLRTGDELARIGGDEFTVLLRNVPDGATASAVADRLLATVSEPFQAGGDPVTLGLSVGIALSGGDASAETLLARADEALYEAKRAGGLQARVAG